MNRINIIIFLSFLCIYTFFVRGYIYTPSADSAWSYYTAKQILFKHTLELEYRDSFKRSVKGKNGKIYCVYPMGRHIIYLPSILLGTLVSMIFKTNFDITLQLFSSFVVPFFSALTMVILYNIFILFNKKKINILCSLIVSGFGSLFFLYSRNTQVDIIQTFFILLGFFLILLYRYKNDKIIYIVLSGVSIAAACSLKIYTVILTPAFLIYILLAIKRDKIKSVLLFLMPIGIYFIIQMIIFYNLFGYHRIIGRENTNVLIAFQKKVSIYRRLIILLLTPYRGIIFYAFPVIIGFILSIKKFSKLYKHESIFILLSFLIYFTFIITNNWVMGSCYGPRYLIPPIMLLSITTIKLPSKYIKAIMILVILFVLVHLPYLFIKEEQWVYTILTKGGYQPFSEFLNYNSNFMLSEIFGNWILILPINSFNIINRAGNSVLIDTMTNYEGWYKMLPQMYSIIISIIFIILIIFFWYKLVKYFYNDTEEIIN